MKGHLLVNAKVIFQGGLLADRADLLRFLRLAIEQEILVVVVEVGEQVEALQVWAAVNAAHWILDSLTSELKLTPLARHYDKGGQHYGVPGEQRGPNVERAGGTFFGRIACCSLACTGLICYCSTSSVPRVRLPRI